MDFIKDNDEVTIDPSAIRVKSHADVTNDRDRIVATIDSSNITVIQREVRNTVDNDIIDVSAAHFHVGMEGIDMSNARFSTQYDISSITIHQGNTEGILSGSDDVSAAHVHIGLDGVDISLSRFKMNTIDSVSSLEFGKDAKISTNNLDVCLNTLDISFTSQDYLDKIGVTRQEIGTGTQVYRLDNFLKINKGLYRFQDHREGYIEDAGPIVYDDNKLILTCQNYEAFFFIFIEFRLTEGDIDDDSLQVNGNGGKTFTPYWNKDTTTGLYWRHYDSRYLIHSPRSKDELETLLAGSWNWDTLGNDGTIGYLLTGQIPFTIIKHADILTVESNKVRIQGNYLDFTNNGEITTHNQLNTLPIDFTDINYLNALGIKRREVGTGTGHYELLNFLDFRELGSDFIGVYVYHDNNKTNILYSVDTRRAGTDYWALDLIEFSLTNRESAHPNKGNTLVNGHMI